MSNSVTVNMPEGFAELNGFRKGIAKVIAGVAKKLIVVVAPVPQALNISAKRDEVVGWLLDEYDHYVLRSEFYAKEGWQKMSNDKFDTAALAYAAAIEVYNMNDEQFAAYYDLKCLEVSRTGQIKNYIDRGIN